MMNNQLNICFVPGCKNITSYTCKCQSPYIYVCVKHLNSHMTNSDSPSEHKINLSFRPPLKGEEKTLILEKIDQFEKKFKNYRQNSINVCIELKYLIDERLKILISEMKKTQTYILKLKKIILSDEPVNIEMLSFLDNTINYKFDTTTLKNNISELLTFNFFRKSLTEDKMLFVIEKQEGLHMLNLNTLEKSNFNTSSKKWHRSASCILNDDELFIIGGMTNGAQDCHGQARIINLRNNSVIKFPNISQRTGHSCVFKDNIIYIFGGISVDKNHLRSSLKFDLKQNTWWEDIPCMPANSATSSSLINNKIIIVGNKLEGAYLFDVDTNTYTINLKLSTLQNSPFIVCNKWVLVSTNFYECMDLENNRWNRYDISDCGSNESQVNSNHKMNQYIYFINSKSELFRIDVELKSAIKII